MTGRAARPLRITFLIGSLDVGGAEQQLVRLVNALDRERFQPSILCLYRGGPLEEKVAAGIPVDGVLLSRVAHRRVRSKVLLALRILWTVARGIRRQRPDILHAYMPTAYVLGAIAARALGVRRVIASRRALVSYHVYEFARWQLLARFANHLIDVHLCNSEAVREYAIAREGLPRSRTEVIPNGLDLPDPGAARPLPPAWRDASATVLAGTVANLISYKNHPLLLRAVARVVEAEPGFRVVLLGDGPERGRLEALAAELGITANVVFAGSVPGAAALLPGFDLTILASDEEGMPNAVMESLAWSVPVVATAVGGTVELIDDGVEGLLVPAGDDGALAGAILRLVQDPDLRRRMGEAGRRRVETRLSVARMVEATEALYSRLAGRAATAPVTA